MMFSAGGALLLALNLAVFGAHAVVPFRIAAGTVDRRRAWALAAPVTLLTSVLLSVAFVARSPDEAAAWGLPRPLLGSPLVSVLALSTGALLLADLVTAVGWRRFDPASWRALGALGGVGAASHAFGSELLRAGWGPVSEDLVLLLLVVALRLPLALAAGELVAGRPRLWSPLAAPAIVGTYLAWPSTLRAALAGGRVTLAAAATLLLISVVLPERMRRWVAVGGVALAVLFLARSAEVSRILASGEVLPDLLVAP
jgi:hypothetical protein